MHKSSLEKKFIMKYYGVTTEKFLIDFRNSEIFVTNCKNSISRLKLISTISASLTKLFKIRGFVKKNLRIGSFNCGKKVRNIANSLQRRSKIQLSGGVDLKRFKILP